MSFGLGCIEAEKAQLPVEEPGECIEVIAMTRKNGAIGPISFIHKDREYIIDKIIYCRDGRELKQGVPGIIYRCSIQGRLYDLLYNGRRWYILGV